MSTKPDFQSLAKHYLSRLNDAAMQIPLSQVERLAMSLRSCLDSKKQVFIFGNGGSAGNAIHLTNDFIYGISKQFGQGLRMQALPANQAMITCLANDVGYEAIFSYQLSVLAQEGDIVIALSGSGNSPNIIKALEFCRSKKLESYSVLGFDGGKAKGLCDVPIHIPVDDMQISEDLQLVVGHMLMQWLYAQRETFCS